MPARRKLLVLGVHRKSEGYPNTLFRIKFLQNASAFDFTEINHPFTQPAFSRKNKGRIARGKAMICAGISHVAVLLRYLAYVWGHGGPDIAYLPYPAIVTASSISMLPRRLRPGRLILDAFISLYDTAVLDRKLLRSQTWAARLLYAIERRAFRSADSVIVDTPDNARYLAKLFDLPVSKFAAIPLSIDEHHFSPAPNPTKSASLCNVLFIGTMIPLHGIRVIADAMQQLGNRGDLHIHLFGDGQDADLIEGIMPLPANVSWDRSWQGSAKLAEAIRAADICLGIFGESDKSQRVCPYKIYAYASVGRAIITGKTDWSIAAGLTYGADVFALVEPGNSKELAQRIIDLAQNPQERSRLATASQDYYRRFLSNLAAHEQLMQLLNGSAAAEQHQKTQP